MIEIHSSVNHINPYWIYWRRLFKFQWRRILNGIYSICVCISIVLGNWWWFTILFIYLKCLTLNISMEFDFNAMAAHLSSVCTVAINLFFAFHRFLVDLRCNLLSREIQFELHLYVLIFILFTEIQFMFLTLNFRLNQFLMKNISSFIL